MQRLATDARRPEGSEVVRIQQRSLVGAKDSYLPIHDRPNHGMADPDSR